jgi:hypothetical protein
VALCVLASVLFLPDRVAFAAESAGVVLFNTLPVPGAIVTLTQGDHRVQTVTDEAGHYQVGDLADGTWTIDIELFGFVPIHESIEIAPTAEPASWTLTLRPFEEVRAQTTTRVPAPAIAVPPSRPAAVSPSAPPAASSAAAPTDAPAFAAAAGFLINGSVNNGASSPFAQLPAFGNNRRLGRSLYNGGLGIIFGSSTFDARPFSFTSQAAPMPSYNDVQVQGTFSGPIHLPWTARRPTLSLVYQHTANHDATTMTALVPTLDQRAGVVSPSLTIPTSQFSPQAQALLHYFPLPNATGDGFNYQAPAMTALMQDSVQARVNGQATTRDSYTGSVTVQHIATDATSLFGYTDATRQWGLDLNAAWTHRISMLTLWRARYQLSLHRDETTPYFAGRVNVSGDAGISGTDQSSENWGPPSLSFANGLAGLSTALFSATRPTSHDWSGELLHSVGRHAWTFGAGVGLRHLDASGQQNGRGSLVFTGAFTGSDFGDFLLGLPGAVSLAYGNRDKTFRGQTATLYANDDWRVSPSLTVNAGVRWEYESPLSEAGGRLANLDLTSNFAAAGVVTPASLLGSVTGQTYPAALLRSDFSGLQPRVGLAWRPMAASSLIVRAGYGAYRNQNVYQTLALLLAQQPPFSNTFSLTNTPATNLTLANAFAPPATSAFNTFAIDPNLRVGVAHNWQASVQRDFPASLTLITTYFGTAGRHLMQEFLPNTVPAGATNPCPSCPSGYVYLTSGGHSLRNALQVQLRRRLRNGFTASAQYTLAKATDNASLFVPSGDAASTSGVAGATIAQNWLDLGAEDSRSSFDQRHQFTAQVQYTTGMGTTGGAFIEGLRGKFLRGWTLTGQVTLGSGLPLTPLYLAPVGTTGVTGTIRGSLTGVTTAAPDGYFANPAAYAAPAPGEWGTAGRNSINGPAQYTLNTGLGRSFQLTERMTFDCRLDANNLFNQVTYASINTIVGTPQFGLPNRANTMRKIQLTARMRF